jgi:hypothetical protein
MRRALLALLTLALAAPAAANPAIDALVAAYPDHLAGHDGKVLTWKDGTRMPITDGRQRTFQQMLDDPDILSQFAIPYPLGPLKTPGVNEDPGRIRYEPLFRKMYGDCRKGEVAKRLASMPWMPKRGGKPLQVTTVNGVNQRLADVVRELETLPSTMTQYLVPSAGTYNCRTIVNTSRLSVHAFAAAIDISTKFSDYWEWSKRKDGGVVWRNRIPQQIADMFERHGFIWGARWYHVDSMHFEYRPELIALAKKGGPQR